MKIAISSPDGMGDFILRVPMITALGEAGHKLQLFLREPAASLAEVVFPEAELNRIEADPYHHESRTKKNPFKREHRAIRRFRPDLYVASLFSLNFFDEVWIEWNRGHVPMAGFTTQEDFWTSGTIRKPGVIAEQFRIRVEVPVDLPELEKNRRLGSAILGVDLPEVMTRLSADSTSLQQAKNLLKKHGIEEGGYLVACVGGRSGLRMKDWGEKNWRRFFESIYSSDGRPVLFLGNAKEAESIERIRSSAFRSVNLSLAPPPIRVSLALASLSSGYVGRDSGVMHMAAAVGRPVLAAYGGGHWGRFFPSSGPAVVVSQSISCRGCNFSCPHERPHCITGISMKTMLEGWRRLPDVHGVEVLEQEPDPKLDVIPVSEAHAFAMTCEADERTRVAKARSQGIFGRLFGR